MRSSFSRDAAEISRTAAGALLVVGLFWATGPVGAQDAPRKSLAPAVVPLDGVVDFSVAKGFERRLERAMEAKSDLLVIEIDVSSGTPEGTRLACEAIRRAGGVRKVAFVPRRAIGPGAAASLCCDEIYLRSDAVIGDLSSIVGQGGERAEWTKLLESWAREQRRPAGLVAMLVGENDRRAGLLNGLEAVAEHFADGNADRDDEVFSRLGATVGPETFAETWVDASVGLLNHPVATTALVVTGLIFLYIEVAAGGIGLAALPGAICFLLFFWSKFLGGTAGWLEVVLFAAGIACLLLEIFVIPGFGVVGASGIALVLLSLVMATQGFLLPRTATDSGVFAQTLIQWSAGSLLFIAGAAAITKRLGGLPVLKHLVLAPGDEGDLAGATASIMPTIMTGTAATDLRPVGKARFGDRLYDVVTDGFYIRAGDSVRVIESSPTRVLVTKV